MATVDIPGYKIVKTLGVGGQATVYLAIQKGFEREVALKVMSPVLAADPSFGERFIREAKIVAKLSHKSIVTVYDVGESGGFYYLAMEYLPGGDLKYKINAGMKAREALEILSKLARALDFAHKKGYIHRDVKSENILFDADDEPLLTDFGIAKASNSSTQMTQTGKLIGTPEYMSPEQCRGKKLDGRSDLYSLGIILYEILTKSVPYTGEDSVAVCIMHVTKPVPQFPVRLKHFQWLLTFLLAKDPNKRFQTGAELAKAIDEFRMSGKQVKKRKTTTITQSKQVIKKAEKNNSNDLLNVAEEPSDQSFEALHSEQRLYSLEPEKSHISKFVFLFFMLGFIAIGFLTQDKWLPNAKEKYAELTGKPLSNENMIEKDKPLKQLKNNELPVQNDNLAQSKINEQNNNKLTNKTNQPADPKLLLDQADQLIRKKPLNLNDAKQALKLVTTVKTLNANNQNADLLYENILNTSLAQAATYAENKTFDIAKRWINFVEVESPKHALLVATKQNIKSLENSFNSEQQQEANKKATITNLLLKADKALLENRLSSPPNDNAIALYRKVLVQDSNNQQAIDGLNNVAKSYKKLINNAIEEKSFARARSMLTRYNSISSDEQSKQEIKNVINNAESNYRAAIAKQEKQKELAKQKQLIEQARQEKLSDPLIQMRLNSTLESAKNLESQGALVEPSSNNALAKFNAALEIDDQNKEAKSGILRIEQALIEKINLSITNADKAQALQWLEKLKHYSDKHPKINEFELAIKELETESELQNTQSQEN